ncbi:hypothetical protein F4819DRAFT_446406 [Hypoxylon fuscum]|nr:hypothetical protein F4819DRAFT_446406 [Hypoxylon fuscum]
MCVLGTMYACVLHVYVATCIYMHAACVSPCANGIAFRVSTVGVVHSMAIGDLFLVTGISYVSNRSCFDISREAIVDYTQVLIFTTIPRLG